MVTRRAGRAAGKILQDLPGLFCFFKIDRFTGFMDPACPAIIIMSIIMH
jgi:hypothetical protein